MTTTTRTPDIPATVPAPPCGPDCVYLDDACRCYHGEPAPPAPAWMDRIVPPF
jgi:hypothetical protein